MDTFQRRNIIILMGLQLLGGAIALSIFLLTDRSAKASVGLGIFLPIIAGLLYGYWHSNWQYAPNINIIIGTIITVFFLLDPGVSVISSTALYLPAGLAVVMLNANWTLAIGIITYAGVLLQAHDQSTYWRIDQQLAYGIVVVCLFAGRRSTELAEQAARSALKESQASQAELSQAVQATEQQANELRNQNKEQERLIQRITELELPLVHISESTLLVPLIGNVNAERIDSITNQLLNHISQQHVQEIVLDVSGVTATHQDMIKQLIRLIKAIRLIGTTVIISGISSRMATTLAEAQIELPHVQIVRSPYEALQQLNLIQT